MKFDAYNLKARVLPTIITALFPTIIFNYFYTSEEFAKFVGYILGIKLLSLVGLSYVFLIFLSQLTRMIAKGIFESHFFNNELSMPTTIFMLFKDATYSDDYKIKFRKKVSSDFGFDLSNKDQEKIDEEDARRKIVESMAFIRKKLQKNTFLLQHNIEYGFMRNAIGGAVIGLILCFGNIYFFKEVVENGLAVNLSIFLTVLYGLLLVFSKLILNVYGKSYAKILFREYMGKK